MLPLDGGRRGGDTRWTTYVCTDLTGADVDPYHYELNILPQMVGGVTITAND